MTKFPQEEETLEITETRIIRRLKVKNIFSSILEAFNLERGALYTIYMLFVNPGDMVRRYVGAERLKFISPFKLLFVSTAITLYIIQKSNSFAQFKEGFYLQQSNVNLEELLFILAGYFNIFLWLFIPIAALFTWLLNTKGRFNYAENLALQAYLLSLSNIISLFVVLDLFVNTTLVSGLILLIYFFYAIYGYKEFYQKSWGAAIGQGIVIHLLSSILYFIVGMVITVAAIFIYAAVTGKSMG